MKLETFFFSFFLFRRVSFRNRILKQSESLTKQKKRLAFCPSIRSDKESCADEKAALFRMCKSYSERSRDKSRMKGFRSRLNEIQT